MSRTSYYRWCARAERYGLSALMPKGGRRPQVCTQTPAHEEEVILAEAIYRPTLGARRLLEHLVERATARRLAFRRSSAATTWGPAGSGWRLSPPSPPRTPAWWPPGPGALRVLPVGRPAGRCGRPGLLLRRQAEDRRYSEHGTLEPLKPRLKNSPSPPITLEVQETNICERANPSEGEQVVSSLASPGAHRLELEPLGHFIQAAPGATGPAIAVAADRAPNIGHLVAIRPA